jgi:thiol-disulfide isomerase/thioredoxin
MEYRIFKHPMLKRSIGALLLLFLPVGIFAKASSEKNTQEKDARNPGSAGIVGEPALSGTEGGSVIEGHFFYEELCSSCTADMDRFASILQEKLPMDERDQYPNSFRGFNIHETIGRARYVELTDELGLDRSLLETPFFIIGGRVFQGYDSISANIKEAYLTAAEDLYVNKRPYNPRTKKTGSALFDDYPVNPDHATLVYYYRITCPECAKTTPIIDALPKMVQVNGKERPLDIIRINTRSGNNNERIAAFFEAWQVPDKDRMVPIVFFSDSYLAGIEAISEGLQRSLIRTPMPWKLLPERR